MASPRLNVPLTLETPVKSPDGLGGFDITWRALGVIWAEMKSSSGRQRGAELGPMSTVGWRITVRAAKVGDPRRPRAEQRLRMGQRVFSVDAVAESDAEGRWLTCFAHEEDKG